MLDGGKGVEAPDTVSLGPLNGSLGFLLRLAQLETFRGFFDALGDLQVRPGEMTVLLLLAQNPGVVQGQLARRLAIKRAHMTKLVKSLEARKLVKREVCVTDRRAILLSLTSHGKAEVAKLGERFERHEQTPSGHLSAGEEEQLKSLLRRYLGLES